MCYSVNCMCVPNNLYHLGKKRAKQMFGECHHPPSLCRWLIEVNASPSYTPSSQEDYEMKCRLLEDTLNVVDMEGR